MSGSLLRDRLDNLLPLPPSLTTRPSLDCYAQITTPKQTETEKTRRAACFIFLLKTIVSSKLLFSLLYCPLLKIHVFGHANLLRMPLSCLSHIQLVAKFSTNLSDDAGKPITKAERMKARLVPCTTSIEQRAENI